ncbi:uncharacterized protein [Ptychodera flava]|uniref:uncharacterized protein n=1 Tax=Ptychodera flava TaxID=63121 RepID=UPI00396AA0D4
MDLVMIPLKLELRGRCVGKIWLPFVGTVEKVIFDVMIWGYTTRQIEQNIFNKGDLEPDNTPPEFTQISIPEANLDSSKRSIATVTDCKVEQVPQRDEVEPAFTLAVAAGDDKSEVDLTYCVGTYKSGCDIFADQTMGGQSVIIAQILPDGVPLHFTVKAMNSAKNTAMATCFLPTYDVTLPEARIVPDFYSTSRPDVLRVSAVAYDDSPIVNIKIGVGFGYGIYGDQMIPWTDVTSHSVSSDSESIMITSPLENFTKRRLGRLPVSPYQTASYKTPTGCSQRCLPLSKCISFNYDFGSSGLCELLNRIEGIGTELHESGQFYYFEKLGVGGTMQFSYNNLQLRHADMHYVNMHVINSLGYENIIASRPIVADFDPPSPGRIQNKLYEEFSHEQCDTYLLEEWKYKCADETTLPNHRLIIDGPGSATVFNGHEPLVDLLYTRANTYISANWDGFHDDETGIFGYSWAVGTSPCMEDVVTHNDPHSHIVNEKEWTHRGSTRNFKVPILPDGRYYITVRAVNKVDFGGPMATTVCHSTPYTIDTTPPFVNEVLFLGYDEDTCTIGAMYNVSDDLSYIREIDMGLGKSKRDIYIMDWKRDSNTTHADKQHCIPDGLPAWIKIRAINNVDLNTVGHAASPFIVDTSPPTAGEVFDGRVHDHDIDYQNKVDEICVSWHSFYDEHSGLEKYTWHVGTSPGDNDTIPYVELEPSTHRICNDSVILTHNTTYYSTITAYNAGHKKLSTNVTTDGVLYDETEPVEGWIKDGLDPARDMAFGSKAASVSANWNEYFDPESNIKEYIVTVWRRHAPQGNSTPPFHIIHDSESIPSSDNSINWHHFHLHHMDYVFVELQTINKALTGIKTETDGYLVDLTVPIFKFLGDGTTLGGNIKYTSSPKELSANWNFEDPESDIEIYRISVRETYGGTTLKIYPRESDSEEVDSSAFTWTSEDLPLINGAHYSIRVTAVNGAGLSNVQDTDGVFVDTTSPIMRLVSIGVLSEDEEEEIIDGFVLQTDTEGIRAYWKATDFESGVVDYLLSIGTSEGATDVKDFTSMGPKEGGYIDGLQLQKYSVEDFGPVYYLTVRAINGAGTESSNMTSSAIRIVAEDKTGLVFDGPEDQVPGESMDGYVDIDYQRETGTVTAQFNGFESEQHGIAHYEWAVGSRPGLDDIQPYISNGILINQYESGLGDGLVGSGLAQSLLQLDPEVTYYTTIRALTGAGNALDSTSDGFTVDTSPPIVDVDSQGILRQNQTVETNLGIYQKFSDSIVDSWHVTEDESEVYFTEFCYGSYPGASDVYSCTDSEGRESTPIALVQPNTDNLPNVITVSSVNKVGLWSKESSRGVTVDTTPPIKGSVVCPSFITTTDDLKCTWSGFYDAESGISHYMFAIGVEEEDDSIYPFTTVAASLNEHIASGPFERKTYYVTVTAVNNVGESTNSYSQPIHIDETPPIGGRVVELTGVDEQRFDDDNDGASERLNCMTLEDCVSKAAVCQRSLDRIFVTWEPFEDAESPIVRYQVAVGTSPGGAQLKTFYDVEVNNRLMAVITGVNLYDVRKAFVSVRGFNAAGLHTTAVSNGIYISRISAGLPPLEGSYVWDGNGKVDLDYQDSNEALFGQWHFDGDPCPKLKYEWSIYKIDGTLVQPKIETTDAFGMNDGFDMKNGETYYLVVRATNQLGYSHSLRSDGITIQLEPLVPRDVRDGDVYGFDLNYQSSITELSANWDAFGVHPGQSTGLLGGQVIERYEVAAGTDQRYPNTRDDIHQFVNVGLNTSHTFTNLRLIPETQTYYITLRAFAVSTAMVEVTSNGIRVGFGGELLSQGQISIQRYIPSPSSLTLSWSNFKFTMPVLFYTWGIGSNTSTLHSLSCKDLQLSVDHGGYQSDEDQGLQDLFEEKAWTEVGKDTMVEQTGLNLKDKETYTVVVMATDESGHCSLASSDFTVDETPPDAGRLKIGAFEDEEIVRTARDDMLFVSWSNFNDAESGIESYSIALYDGISCGTDEDQVVLQDFIDILPNDTDYNFVDLELKPQTPYFINLRATNNAGLATTVISQPIILDFEQPTVGVVKDGIDFQTDKDYQSSTSTVEGVFLHLPNPHGDSCPSRRFSMATDDTDEWNVVKTRGIWGVDDRDSIAFRQEQLSFNEDDDSLSITLVRDVRDVKMYSGALYHPEPDIVEGGQYQVDILAASGEHAAVTTVVFWDGPDGVLGDFNVPFDDSSWDDDVVEFDPCKVCCLANNTQIEKETSCPCNCTEYLESKTTTFTTVRSTTTIISTSSQTAESAATPPPWQIIEDVDEDDTYKGDDRLKSVPQQSFGFQLHPAVRVGGDTRHFVVLWFRFQNSTEPVKYDFAELDFDPSQAWHTYRLDVINEMDAISVELFTDGKSVMFMSGIPTFSPDAKFILSVWNRDAYVPSFEDVFSPPTATASFRSIRFPPSSDALCKFGEPFRNGDSAIKAFFAGVGSEKFQADVVPFQEIVRPCLPCTNPCESSACDPECSYTTVQTYSVVLRGLSLNSTRSVEEGGELKPIPAVYHLTIKAVTGSGRYVLTSSNGIYVDDTPPVFDYLYHIDVSWSLDQPIKYQGSNTTIAVRWSAYDIGSQVHEYKWAIGSRLNATDVQPFLSVGLETFAANENLLGVLEDRKTYYVTVVAVNRAGLTTTLVTSGVTLMLTPPDVTASNATSECDDNDINTDLADANLCGSQSSTGMKWTRVEDDSVDSYLFSIGSSEETEDIFSKLQVGYNASGAVEIKDGLVYIGDEAIANVSGVRDPATDVEVIKNRFHMEPGRTMFSKITVCNKGHKCEEMATSVTTIARKGDALSSPSDGSGPELLLPSDDDVITIKSGQESHKATRKRNINKREEDNSEDEVTLMAGFLSNDDLHDEYASDASRDFKPFIVNPDVTMDQTDRALRNRIKEIVGPSFYITTIGRKPMSEPLNITIGFNVSRLNSDDRQKEVKLIFWQTDLQEWQDSSDTCAESEQMNRYDLQNGIISIQVCSTENNSKQHLIHRRSPSTSSFFKGPTLFTVAIIGEFVNSPPSITSVTDIWMWEDAGTLRFQVAADDDDGDDVVFALEGRPHENDFGVVVLSPDGELSYTPCLDCFGLKSVQIVASEDRTDNYEALTTPKTLNIDVRGINDNPDIFLVTDPSDVADGMVQSQIVTTEEKKEDNDDRIFKAVVGAFDPDTFDTLTLLFDLPQHGTLQIGVQHTAVEFINDDCLPLSNITDDYLGHNNSDVDTVLFPCKLPIPHSADRLAWVFSTLTYIPEKDFHGEDSFKLNAVDQSGAHSDVITVKVYVLANPCLNGGVCNGTESDPDCTSTDRAKGFDGYSCACPPGLIGDACLTDYNECDSNPCPSNFTCIDQINSFACYCENVYWPCGGGRFSPTVIIAAVCSGVILAVVVIIIARRPYLKKKKQLKIAPEEDALNKAFDLTYGNFDDSLELKEKKCDDVIDKNNNEEDDSPEPTAEIPETAVDDDVDTGDFDDVEEIEAIEPVKSLDDTGDTTTKETEPKILMSVEQRFGFVDRPAIPKRAWGRVKSARMTFNNKVSPFDEMDDEESQA